MDEFQEAIRCRSLLIGLAGATAREPASDGGIETAKAAQGGCGNLQRPVAPIPYMNLTLKRTALVVIDPQVGLLSREGEAWPALGKSIVESTTIHNLSRLFKAAKHAGITVAISLTSGNPKCAGSGFIPGLKQYIEDGESIICSPDTLYSPLPWVSDIGLRLRQRRVNQVILSGMIADRRIEFHLRDFLEQGFEVAIVRDAVVGPKLPAGDGYLTTLINFRRIANALWTTRETVGRLRRAKPDRPYGHT